MLVRTRHRTKSGEAKEENLKLKPTETVLFLIDMWNHHWCKGVNAENEILAVSINQALYKFRELGIKIIHIPSDTMEYYMDTPQRKKMIDEPKNDTSRWLWYGNSHWFFKYGRFPISVRSDGGCSCQPSCESKNMVWKKQHSAIEIKKDDLISDNPIEIYNYLKNRKIKNIIYSGIHLNICLLDRPIGIRKMNAKGFNCFLSRDLTAIMYNPKYRPKTSKENALKLVIHHFESYFGQSFVMDEVKACD